MGKGQMPALKDWKQLLSQKKAAKRSGAVAVPRIAQGRSDSQKRHAANAQTGELISKVHGQNVHMVQTERSVEGEEAVQERNRSVTQFMDLLTRGNQAS